MCVCPPPHPGTCPPTAELWDVGLKGSPCSPSPPRQPKATLPGGAMSRGAPPRLPPPQQLCSCPRFSPNRPSTHQSTPRALSPPQLARLPGITATLAGEPALPPAVGSVGCPAAPQKEARGTLWGTPETTRIPPPSPQGGARSPQPPPKRSRRRRSATDLFLKRRGLTPRLREQGGSRGWHRHRRPWWEPWPQRGAPPAPPRAPPPAARSGGVAPSSSSRLRPWRRGWSTWPPWPGWCWGRGELALRGGGGRGSGVRGTAGSPQPPPSTLGQLALTRVPLLPPHHGDGGAARRCHAGGRGGRRG